MRNDFKDWAKTHQSHIEASLVTLLPTKELLPERLHDAMRFSVLGGGKRIRPLLAFAAGELSEADEERVTIAGVAVELIHAYSLVHDDLPCMDDDILRRGKPTCHIEYNEATALLVGDSLQSLAFQLLAEYHLADTPKLQLNMIKLLAQAAGSRGMAGGQAFDLESVGKTLNLPELEFMHIHKTGALIRAAVMIGACCGNNMSDVQLKSLDHFTKHIGLAFQVVDDVLDTEATTVTLGKTAGKDADNNKPTYVSILGVKKARELAEQLRLDAYQELEIFGEKAARLRQLTDYIIQRDF